ncbi:MAG: NUDIX hydrolase [Magnetococcus sp. DMHC-6]
MREHPDYYYSQSAVIPFRRDNDEIKILLISSRRKNRWVIPKGIIEADLDPPSSAAKEALEEAGIEGSVIESPIGTYEYDKWGGTCQVQVFVMEVEKVLDDWLENFRDRIWVDLPTACVRLEEHELCQMIEQLPEFLQANPL